MRGTHTHTHMRVWVCVRPVAQTEGVRGGQRGAPRAGGRRVPSVRENASARSAPPPTHPPGNTLNRALARRGVSFFFSLSKHPPLPPPRTPTPLTMADDWLLYTTEAGWGLPSLEPSSIQAQVYLHLAGVPLSVQECSLSRSAPTGETVMVEGGEGLWSWAGALGVERRWPPTAERERRAQLSLASVSVGVFFSGSRGRARRTPNLAPPPLSLSLRPARVPPCPPPAAAPPAPAPGPHSFAVPPAPPLAPHPLTPPLPPPLPSPSPPKGVTPSLEHRGELVDAPASSPTAPADAAAAVIAYAAAQGADLDAWLSPAQRADAAAFACLARTALEPASAFTTWCEPASFPAAASAHGADLPFPLSALLPRAARRAAGRRFAGVPRERIYGDAAAAVAALADRLASSPGPFFFGARPCGLDAALYAHLAFHRAAPVAAPELRAALDARPRVGAYVDAVAARLAALGPPPPRGGGGGGGAGGGSGQHGRGVGGPGGGGPGGVAAGRGGGAQRRRGAPRQRERAGKRWGWGAFLLLLAKGRRPLRRRRQCGLAGRGGRHRGRLRPPVRPVRGVAAGGRRL